MSAASSLSSVLAEDLRFIRSRIREIALNAVESLDELAYFGLHGEGLNELVAELKRRATMMRELSEQLDQLVEEVLKRVEPRR
jgi:hypothetical protein